MLRFAVSVTGSRLVERPDGTFHLQTRNNLVLVTADPGVDSDEVVRSKVRERCLELARKDWSAAHPERSPEWQELVQLVPISEEPR